MTFPAEDPTGRRGVNAQNPNKIMGDKSPKSNQKLSSQKQAKARSSEEKRQQAAAAKQVPAKKK